jgi:DNA-binding Lrp family transcriptional regulator
MKAFVQVSTDQGRVSEVFDDLQSTDGVKQVHMLFGEWDLLVHVEAPTAGDLANFVLEKIRNTPGVKITSTMIVAQD